eukprot:CAMPEP_0176159480 /NCGR_PEP_ID=MMETSP0120_2-20121206/81583_1 /TAXON_ID=160619 /ORGANISM="Kryptoperidinium foliaceum, Strain CCMP 1326" /LENGTH=151 /DNA_ID=CAMNT_0017496899 /DNA_START=55 /DNA_END=507 /DNA_ORIENTATION=+
MPERPKADDGDSLVRSSPLGNAKNDFNCILLSKPTLFHSDESASEQGEAMDVDQPVSDLKNTEMIAAGMEAGKEESSSKPQRSLSHLKSFKVKRQIVPLALPPVPPGSPPNQPVPSHPSHMQSVQSSVAAQWSNGRTELWPLQILSSRAAS